MKAVGFDLDYTLAVAGRDRTALLREATAAVGAPRITRDEYLAAHDAAHAGETREPIFARLLDGRAADADPGDLADAYRRALEEELVPVEGAADLVTRLRADYRVGLLTDGPVRAQRGKLRRLGWVDLFDAVIVTGSLPAKKPDPRTFAALLGALGVGAHEAVYVGDHPEKDVGGATEAGLRAVQVVYDGGPDPDPRADAVVERDRLAERLPGVVAGLDG